MIPFIKELYIQKINKLEFDELNMFAMGCHLGGTPFYGGIFRKYMI